MSIQLHAAKEVIAYLNHRAAAEGVSCKLTPSWLIAECRNNGTSIFDASLFGIRVSRETGKIVADGQQPWPGFLDGWNNRVME